MREIVPTRSKMTIKAALRIENAYEQIAYDGSPPLPDFDVSKMIWFILLQDGYTAGIICLSPLNNVMWTPHIVIFKKYRGASSEEWGQLVAKHMKRYYGAKKFLALTPYATAKRYAEAVGFKQIGVLSKSIQKNGELLDQYIMEMG
jgi:hypothetical protein